MKTKCVVIILLPLIAACTMIDYSRTVPGWPQMTTTETKVSIFEASRRCRATQSNPCSRSTATGIITSCYQWNFDTNHDWIWYGLDSDLEHERAHHRGHPHLGEGDNSIMKCYLDEWKAKRKKS